jgi:hypothetical protein
VLRRAAAPVLAPKSPTRSPGGGFVLRQPIGQGRHAYPEQANVEPELPFLLGAEQVDEHRGQAGTVKFTSHITIPQHCAVILLGGLDRPRILLGVEQLVLSD